MFPSACGNDCFRRPAWLEWLGWPIWSLDSINQSEYFGITPPDFFQGRLVEPYPEIDNGKMATIGDFLLSTFGNLALSCYPQDVNID